MYCTSCGKDLGDRANFCRFCGAHQPGMKRFDAKQEQMKEIRGTVTASVEAIKSMNGYYCLGCGNYIDRHRMARKGLTRCEFCNTKIIGTDYVVQGIGSLILKFLAETAEEYLGAGDEGSTLSESKDQVVRYYSSEYYHLNKYPLENVVSDKGITGEYLLNIQIQELKKMLPERSFHVYYNLLIPEPNGSFQEIDALVICGNYIFAIECKNRAGIYDFDYFSDERWELRKNDCSEKVLNPLVQNLEHVSALKYYFKDLDAIPYIVNMTVIGTASKYNCRSGQDGYDNLVLGSWHLGKITSLADMISEWIKNAESRENDLVYAGKEGILSDRAAKIFIKKLSPLISMTEEDKRLLKRERRETSGEHKKYQYKYWFYRDPFSREDMLLRCNGVYMQYTSYYSGLWEVWEKIKIVNGYPKWDDTIPALDLGTSKQLVDAYRCICAHKPYPLYESLFREYYKQKGFNNGSHGAGQKSTSDGITFFSGCDTLGKLKSRYWKLCKVYHPDEGDGDDKTFILMQKEYKELLKYLSEEGK